MRYVEPFPLDMVHNYFLSKINHKKTQLKHIQDHCNKKRKLTKKSKTLNPNISNAMQI